MLSSIIHASIGQLFPGLRVTGCHQFRLTRNSNLWVEEEEADDLLDEARLDRDAVHRSFSLGKPLKHG